MLTSGVWANVVLALSAGARGTAVYAGYSASVSLGYFAGLAAWVAMPPLTGVFVLLRLQERIPS